MSVFYACLSAHLSQRPLEIMKFSVDVTCGRGLGLL